MKKSMKILLTATMCALLALVLAATVFAARKLGDVDGTVGISVSDARQVLRFAVNLDKPSNEEIKAAADVDRDGNITVNDARTVLRAAVGLDKIPDEDALKQECKHEFVAVPVMKNANWSTGKHQLKCKLCGETSGEAVDCTLGDIVYNNGETPNCLRAVNYSQTCSVCGGKKQGTVKKLPHKYTENETVTKQPTCTEAGEKTLTCELCHKATKKYSIRALGHELPTRVLKEGETVKCERCGEELKPADFDYTDNEFLIYASGKYYYTGRAKTLNGGRYEYSDIEFAVNPDKSIYMKMPFDDSTEIGYLAFVSGKNTKKYFHTVYENKNYYFELSDTIIKIINGSDDSGDMAFPTPTDEEFDTKLNVKLEDAEKSLVVYEGKVCTKFTFNNTGKATKLNIYMDGKKLMLIEKVNDKGIVTDATYFDSITSDIPKAMYTTDGEILKGITGLMEFANYIGITA